VLRLFLLLTVVFKDTGKVLAAEEFFATSTVEAFFADTSTRPVTGARTEGAEGRLVSFVAQKPLANGHLLPLK
jgi:hypothetical protein